MKSSFAFDKDVDNTIKTDEWFNVAKFPEAVFEAKSFQLISGKTYVAKGDLTIKSIKLPIVISFNLNEFSAKAAAITGNATVNRTKYGIGWADASSIKDAVKVNIAVKAIAK
jgi:polyisoprenoid-binding protein YceI